MQRAGIREGDTFTYEVELPADERTDRVSVGVLDELSRDYAVASVQLHALTNAH